MRGFFAGTLALIIIETLLRNQNVNQITGGIATLEKGMKRLLSADVAGVPDVRIAKAREYRKNQEKQVDQQNGVSPANLQAPRLTNPYVSA